MGFTTQIFVFIFLPLSLAAYYGVLGLEKLGRFGQQLQKMHLRDWALIAAGLGFYGWACFDGIFRLLLYMLLVYILGQVIGGTWNSDPAVLAKNKSGAGEREPVQRALTCFLVLFLVLILVYSKYWNQVVAVWNWLFGTKVPASPITAPLAISFLTFSSVSYLVDIARGQAGSGSLRECLLYLSFFPKLISGPTVLWRDFYGQIPSRDVKLDGLADGVTRIMIGFVKKVLIADTLGACIAKIPETNVDIPTAWIGAFLYMLQIYYDFAGYSDIAIGLAKLFGFEIRENFHFPYCSASVGEFWRRWHISLGTWFREYVYFPLGGSRGRLGMTLRNLGIVFLLTGIWHGNGWSYLIWGCINGACVILERLLQEKGVWNKIPRGLRWLSTMAITLLCWEFFRFGDLSSVLQWGKTAIGVIRYQDIHTWQYYFDTQIFVIAGIGFLGATLWGAKPVQLWYQRAVAGRVGYAIRQIVLGLLFGVALMAMVSSVYSPFIYFQY